MTFTQAFHFHRLTKVLQELRDRILNRMEFRGNNFSEWGNP